MVTQEEKSFMGTVDFIVHHGTLPLINYSTEQILIQKFVYKLNKYKKELNKNLNNNNYSNESSLPVEISSLIFFFVASFVITSFSMQIVVMLSDRNSASPLLKM